MLRYILYVVFFFLLVRFIRLLLRNTSEPREDSSALHRDAPGERSLDDINEAEIEDATFEEIEETPRGRSDDGRHSRA